MNWKKLGRIFKPDDRFEWWDTHAQLPVAHHLSGDRYRIYIGARNENNFTQIASVDIDITSPSKPLDVSSEPLVELGSLGAFDDSGVYPSSVVEKSDQVYLYYIGWMQGKRVPYYASVGLATSTDNGNTFEKASQGPHLARNDVDPYMTLSSCVRRFDGDWHMWYTSATEWKQTDDKPRPNYHIKYARSTDGLKWERNGKVCIDYATDNEWAIACPTVRRSNGKYEMWYSHVVGDGNYQIGYAESTNGTDWTRRDDDAGIATAEDGWDSDMQAYPNVITHNGATYMFYNGNHYGKDGFGLATLK